MKCKIVVGCKKTEEIIALLNKKELNGILYELKDCLGMLAKFDCTYNNGDEEEVVSQTKAIIQSEPAFRGLIVSVRYEY